MFRLLYVVSAVAGLVECGNNMLVVAVMAEFKKF